MRTEDRGSKKDKSESTDNKGGRKLNSSQLNIENTFSDSQEGASKDSAHTPEGSSSKDGSGASKEGSRGKKSRTDSIRDIIGVRRVFFILFLFD